MPDLTVTLTDAQWAAYQTVSDNVSEAVVTAWLKEQLVANYAALLELADSQGDAVISARNTKITAFSS